MLHARIGGGDGKRDRGRKRKDINGLHFADISERPKGLRESSAIYPLELNRPALNGA